MIAAIGELLECPDNGLKLSVTADVREAGMPLLNNSFKLFGRGVGGGGPRPGFEGVQPHVVSEEFVAVRASTLDQFLFDEFRMEVDKGVASFLCQAVGVSDNWHVVGLVRVGNGARHSGPVATFLQVEVPVVLKWLG
jgi:hypothetical protein